MSVLLYLLPPVLLPAILSGCTAPEADSARPPRAAPLNDVRAATRDMRPGGIGEAIRLGHLPGAGWEPQGAVTAPRGPEGWARGRRSGRRASDGYGPS